jgi:CBS domain-containing membrane protein
VAFKRLFFALNPGFVPVPFSEKFRSSLAAFTGILLLGWGLHLLALSDARLTTLTSMAAASVLLFAAPHSPMAQPWPLLGGNLLSGVVGWGAAMWIPDPVWAAACAVGVSVLVMHLSSCLHPPGAATAMGMVLNGDLIRRHGWQWTAGDLLANIFLLLLLALVINNLIRGRHYPLRHAAPVAAPPHVRGEPDKEDIEWALRQVGGMVDVDEEELIEICRLAADRARKRED